MKDIHVLLSDELLAGVDAARGDASRSLFIRRAVERALESARVSQDAGALSPSPAPAEQPEVYGVRLKSSAEQPGKPPLKSGRELLNRADDFRRASFRRQPGPNVENVRSSEQTKRDVSPRPKGKS